jgi:hypothetical protein
LVFDKERCSRDRLDRRKCTEDVSDHDRLPKPQNLLANSRYRFLRTQSGWHNAKSFWRENGKATLEGVKPGDKLIQINQLEVKHATWGQIYDALHGMPGEMKSLLIERGGSRITLRVPVTAF